MEQEAKEALILRLFRAYPGGENKISRETLNVYLKAVAFFNVPLIAEAIDRFSDGRVDRKSRAFVPSADELATEIRNVRYEKGKHGALRRDAIKQIEARDNDVEKTDHSRAFVKALVSKGIAALDEAAAIKEAETVDFVQQLMNRTNEVFMPPMDDESVRKRLGIGVRYTVGDPDSRED